MPPNHDKCFEGCNNKPEPATGICLMHMSMMEPEDWPVITPIMFSDIKDKHAA